MLPWLPFSPLAMMSILQFIVSKTDTGTAYFLKLRKGNFDSIAVTIPYFLHNLGYPYGYFTDSDPRWAAIREGG